MWCPDRLLKLFVVQYMAYVRGTPVKFIHAPNNADTSIVGYVGEIEDVCSDNDWVYGKIFVRRW